jgi:hypothetical protein
MDPRFRPVWTHAIRLGAGSEQSVRLPRADGTWGTLSLQAAEPVAAAFTGMLGPGGERALAAHYRGSVSAPFALPARGHIFAEGDTRPLLSVPREKLYLANPTGQPATVLVTLLATGGRRMSQSVSLGAHASTTLDLNAWAPPSQHGLVLLSNVPILAARTIDFNQGVDRLYSVGVTAP